jgi:DNA-binding transcriptional ArsR family regulator
MLRPTATLLRIDNEHATCDRAVTMAPTAGETLDALFRCLADETRRRIYEDLGREPGLTTAELAARQPRMTRWAVMKHLAVLRGADLIQTLPEGRRRRHYRDERGLQPLRDWLARGPVR